jgi:hypothetical protein
MSYNKILDYVEREKNNEDGHHWKFRTILGHIHTPIGHKERMGSDYNVKTGWETGAVSVEPLDHLPLGKLKKIKNYKYSPGTLTRARFCLMMLNDWSSLSIIKPH